MQVMSTAGTWQTTEFEFNTQLIGHSYHCNQIRALCSQELPWVYWGLFCNRYLHLIHCISPVYLNMTNRNLKNVPELTFYFQQARVTRSANIKFMNVLAIQNRRNNVEKTKD